MATRTSMHAPDKVLAGWAAMRPGGRPARLLIVEDEALVALSMAEMLATAGYEVLDTVASGRAALDSAARRRPDLVLMDITLRGPMDGIDTARALQETASVPILYVSAYSEGAVIDRAQTTDPVGYLRKPYDGRQLLGAVAAALAATDPEPTPASRWTV